MVPFMMIMLVDPENDTGVDDHDDNIYDNDNKNYDQLVLPDSPPKIIGLSSAHSPGSFLRFDFSYYTFYIVIL